MIPNGVDTNKFRPGEKIPRSILFVGRLSEEKNILNLIRAMGILTNSTLKIIGTGPLENEVKTMIKNLRLTNVEYLGFKANDDLPPYYATAKYICIPSTFEAQPFVLFEGMSAQCIPIVSNVGGMKEIVEDGISGYFTQGLEPLNIAAAIEKADDCPDAGFIGETCRGYVTLNHSWDKIAQEILKVYGNK